MQNFELLLFSNDFFFPVKAEMLYFSKIKKGDQKGDHCKSYFTSNFWEFYEILWFEWLRICTIALPVVPLLVPLCDFRKVQHLSFHWKKKSFKNNKNLKFWVQLKFEESLGVTEYYIFKQNCTQIYYSVTPNDSSNFSCTQNFEFLLFLNDFFFQWKLRCCTFRKSQRGTKMGDHRKSYLTNSQPFKPKNFMKFSKVWSKITLPVGPLLVPLFDFWKVQHLSFHWKKIIWKS